LIKHPHIQFYTGDWMKDPLLSKCAPSTRGIWIDLICAMHESDRCGEIFGTFEQLSRLCRCTPNEMQRAIKELEDTNTATVTINHIRDNELITISNRRMKRVYKDRNDNKLRQAKFRNDKNSNKKHNGPITSVTDNDIDIDIDIDNDIENINENTHAPTKGSEGNSDIQNLVTKFYEYKIKTEPDVYRCYETSKVKMIEKSLDIVDKLIRLDNFKLDEIKAVLLWAVQDDFWNSQIYSLAALRKKGKNGNTKFKNMYIGFKKENKSLGINFDEMEEWFNGNK